MGLQQYQTYYNPASLDNTHTAVQITSIYTVTSIHQQRIILQYAQWLLHPCVQHLYHLCTPVLLQLHQSLISFVGRPFQKFVSIIEVLYRLSHFNRQDQMSMINSTINRPQRPDQSLEQNEQMAQQQNEFISIYQRFNDKIVRQEQGRKKMDMVYNYMVKNDIQTEKKSDQKEEKVRKTRKDKEGRKFICGACKLGYLSYPALYTHIKTKHKGETPEGTIRGESGKPKKRGRPKVRKTPQIYEKQLQKSQFPKDLLNLVPKESLEVLELDDLIEMTEEDQTEISMKYFVGILRDLKKMEKAKLYLLPITQVVTTFLENLKEFVGEQTMAEFEETFFHFINFVNLRHLNILKDYQTQSKYYIECELGQGDVYCEVERPFFMPIFAQKFSESELSVEDEMQVTLLIDFSKWLFSSHLTEIKLIREGSIILCNRQ